ncbi:helix-turn-helix transcriptional regulator [Verrucosispora sp. WMMC514]|uniref:helix-turn-helix domain-containing protein n=1 Tax=Verrucosispora sp. WMMC514 TaxID=3015156 RepID=UPI00248BA839|nr:helix-turn-helix transcriptional regulator [Verrucosispora sp. WMMC514]WBB94266.1 helix-turn-helix transcriptional regulator [Verrucosispora sp. WMMC514]
MPTTRPNRRRAGHTTKVNGAAIRTIRERTEMSIGDVIAHLDREGIPCHPDYLRNIELGRRQPSPRLLGGIARALACPKRALLADPDADVEEPAA